MRESSHKKTNTVWFPLNEIFTVIKFTESESRRVVARGWGRGNGESVFNGCGVSVWEGEKSLELDGSEGCTVSGEWFLGATELST